MRNSGNAMPRKSPPCCHARELSGSPPTETKGCVSARTSKSISSTDAIRAGAFCAAQGQKHIQLTSLSKVFAMFPNFRLELLGQGAGKRRKNKTSELREEPR